MNRTTTSSFTSIVAALGLALSGCKQVMLYKVDPWSAEWNGQGIMYTLPATELRATLKVETSRSKRPAWYCLQPLVGKTVPDTDCKENIWMQQASSGEPSSEATSTVLETAAVPDANARFTIVELDDDDRTLRHWHFKFTPDGRLTDSSATGRDRTEQVGVDVLNVVLPVFESVLGIATSVIRSPPSLNASNTKPLTIDCLCEASSTDACNKAFGVAALPKDDAERITCRQVIDKVKEIQQLRESEFMLLKITGPALTDTVRLQLEDVRTALNRKLALFVESTTTTEEELHVHWQPSATTMAACVSTSRAPVFTSSACEGDWQFRVSVTGSAPGNARVPATERNGHWNGLVYRIPDTREVLVTDKQGHEVARTLVPIAQFGTFARLPNIVAGGQVLDVSLSADTGMLLSVERRTGDDKGPDVIATVNETIKGLTTATRELIDRTQKSADDSNASDSNSN